uniref:Uncharacterized protein n=1 Tax=Anguilla anguilla TaxID=7936 RepID=A0A0E9XJW4_ANGAN
MLLGSPPPPPLHPEPETGGSSGNLLTQS